MRSRSCTWTRDEETVKAGDNEFSIAQHIEVEGDRDIKTVCPCSSPILFLICDSALELKQPFCYT